MRLLRPETFVTPEVGSRIGFEVDGARPSWKISKRQIGDARIEQETNIDLLIIGITKDKV